MPQPTHHQIKVEILAENDFCIAINKPSGLLTVPSALAPDKRTCMSMLRDQLGARVYPVHRLDRATSGVLLFARTSASAKKIAEMFSNRSITKTYIAVVRGHLLKSGTIDHPIAETKQSQPVEAITQFTPLAQIELPIPVGRYATARYTLLWLTPLTGRNHQLRRHLAHLRHPIIGDTIYGDGRHTAMFRQQLGIHRLMLHASSLSLPAIEATPPLAITAPVPNEFAQLFADYFPQR
ncbi:MAG: hypothetical protein IT211_03265 [Armatimonadetes bacterium]|nr:hypothetical protein [Armatimonadota bacterium]